MKIPKQVLKSCKSGTAREWKDTKRKEAKAAKKAIDALSIGCEHFPSGSKDADIAKAAIKRILKDLSRQNFGR